jgi:hypothetical protein
MEIHPILEEWLNDWVWPTPFRGPGVDFRMRLTRERLVPVWNRIVLRALEGAQATEAKYNRGEYPNAFGGYSGEGPRMSMNQMSTQLLTVSIPEQETYLDLLRMRARQLWDEVKHGSLHADVLIRGGQVHRETELMEEVRANYSGSRAYFGLTATFPHIHPLARAAQNYHTEAGACLGIKCTLEVNKNPLAIHENLSQYYEELMHFMEGKYQMDMFCLTPEDQKPVEEALDFLLWPAFVNSRGLVPED